MCPVDVRRRLRINDVFLLLIILKFGLHAVDAVWPLPQTFTSWTEKYPLNPQHFHFGYRGRSAAPEGCPVLDAAFKRYFSLIFPDYAPVCPTGNDKLRIREDKPFSVEIAVDGHYCESYPTEDSSERYNLSVSAGQACLNAETVWGALRGLETFSQLVYQDDSGSDAMAYNLSSKGAFHPMTHIYTQSDVRRVISYARMLGIRVVPEFDSPGHTKSWGKGQLDLLTPCYRRGIASGTFGPINPALASTYQFMESLFKEVSSVFPGSYFHLGGDEVDFSCWRSNPYIRAFMQKMGFGDDFAKLQAFYIEKIVNITTALNKTSIVWQDVFDYNERRSSLSVVEVWKQGCYLCEVRRVVKAGLRVILASPWYLDLPGPTHNWARYYNVWPLAFSGSEEQKRLVIGGEVCLWGEYVDATNLSPRLWPRASAAAERLWSDEKQTSSVENALPRLLDFRCKLLRRGIQAEPLNVGHCRHEYQGV
ncbi:beta-hexosaminidase subunit alpha isoform 5-T5 [Menidia menidia]